MMQYSELLTSHIDITEAFSSFLNNNKNNVYDPICAKHAQGSFKFFHGCCRGKANNMNYRNYMDVCYLRLLEKDKKMGSDPGK